MKPENWDLDTDKNNEILMKGIKLTFLAERYGTPLYVINEDSLFEKAENLLKTARNIYPGKLSVHYPFKCNSVPSVINILRRSGIKAEVMSEFELELAKILGFNEDEIIANGPCKSRTFLNDCFHLKQIIIDSVSELRDLAVLAAEKKCPVNILLRLNPDYIPEGMNSGSAAGSRKGSVFGLDVKAGEVQKALKIIKESTYINFNGIHLHIGTGIRNPDDYYRAILSLKNILNEIINSGFRISVFDTGGGFASPLTRGFTTKELLLYQGFKKFPSECRSSDVKLSDYMNSITKAINEIFREDWPELIIEPGRYLTSSSELLLLKIHRIKERKGAGKWIITDAGIGTITMPAYYEYHEIFLCNDTERGRDEKVTISGPCCFAEDVVYKNKLIPEVNEGEIIAIMDCGAYFHQWESNFGFYRPAVVKVNSDGHTIVRRRETTTDMLCRDIHKNNFEEIPK